MVPWKDEFEVIYCACGCGGELLRWNSKNGKERKYIRYHHKKGKPDGRKNFDKYTEEQKLETKLCECGCGEEILKYDIKYKVERRYKRWHQPKGELSPITGIKRSEEYCQYLSERQIGKTRSEETKQKLSDMWKRQEYREKMIPVLMANSEKIKGSRASEETRIKMSLSRIGKQTGEDHPNWKGGISQDPYCPIWSYEDYKDEIKERDNYECQNPECNKTSNKLCVHHIDYNKKNCHPKNLISVCLSCNARANYDRDYWQELYSKIIERKYNTPNTKI